MKKSILIGTILFLIAAAGAGIGCLFPPPYNQELEQGILRCTNAYRKEHGLPPLQAHSKAHKVAAQKVQEIYDQDYFSHESPTQGDLVSQFAHWGDINLPEDATMIGENLAYFEGYTLEQITPDDIVQAWIDSPPHRENLLNQEYDAIGIAFVWGEDGRGYAAQEFLKKSQ